MLSNITNFPNGITSFGVPIVGGAILTTGNIYFVDSGGHGGDGKTPLTAVATIAEAVTKCTASNDDYIFVAAGHAETLSPTASVAGLTIDKIGCHIIGLGSGALRPTITIAGLAADTSVDGISITGASVEIANIIIAATTTGNITAQIDVAAANIHIHNCYFKAGAEDVVACITVPDAGDNAVIEDNFFEVTANGAGAGIKIESASNDGFIARRNLFNGGSDTNAWDEGAIYSAVVHTNCMIMDNRFLYGGAIIFSDAATGIISGNFCAEGTLGSMIDPGSCMCFENYEADAVDQTARLFPTTPAS